MASQPFLLSPKYSEQQLRAVRDGAHPQILEFERLLVNKLRKLNVPLFATEVWRDSARQTELFVKGHSKAKAGQSAHQYGLAVDIIHSIHGWSLSPRQWELIGVLGLELAIQRGIKITWGGDDPGVDDKFSWDPAHWEIRDWKNHKDSKTWPTQK